MKRRKKGKTPSAALLRELATLEGTAADKGIRVHYDRMEAAGLRLKGGLCALNGEYHLFIEKRKSVSDKIEFLKDQLLKPLPNPETGRLYQMGNDPTLQDKDEGPGPLEIK